MNIPRHIDFRSETVRNAQTLADLSNIPWAPRPSFARAFGGAATIILLAAFLLGLLAVGS